MDALAHIPFIAISALDGRACAAVDLFLHKPIHPSRLVDVVEQFARKRAPSNEPVYETKFNLFQLDQLISDITLRVLDESARMHQVSSVAQRMQSETLHSTLLSCLVAVRRYRRIFAELTREPDATASASAVG
jgi:hypothetical protein